MLFRLSEKNSTVLGEAKGKIYSLFARELKREKRFSTFRLKEVYDYMSSTIKMQPLKCGGVLLNRLANETIDFNY